MTVQQPMPPQPPAVAYVSFSAEITVMTAEQLINTMMNAASQNIPEVHLLMSTPGGSVMHGINIYNVLKGLPFKLVTHNVGNVDSIGNAIFLAGQERYACQHSTFMFHGVGWSADHAQLNAKSAREVMDSLLSDEGRISDIICDRTTITKEQAAAFYEQARTMTAHEAMTVGIVHDVRDVSIPPGAPVATLVFNR